MSRRLPPMLLEDRLDIEMAVRLLAEKLTLTPLGLAIELGKRITLTPSIPKVAGARIFIPTSIVE